MLLATETLVVILELSRHALSGLQEQHSQFEAAVLFIDSVVLAVCSAHLGKGASPNQAATLSSTQALLQLLLGARFADPVLLNWHARSLESFSKLLAMKPELVQAVMQKVESALHQHLFTLLLKQQRKTVTTRFRLMTARAPLAQRACCVLLQCVSCVLVLTVHHMLRSRRLHSLCLPAPDEDLTTAQPYILHAPGLIAS